MKWMKNVFRTIISIYIIILSSGHVQVWGLDHKEAWAQKNWCFQTVVLEKTLKSPITGLLYNRRERAGHNFWKNDIAQGHNLKLVRIKLDQDGRQD